MLEMYHDVALCPYLPEFGSNSNIRLSAGHDTLQISYKLLFWVFTPGCAEYLRLNSCCKKENYYFIGVEPYFHFFIERGLDLQERKRETGNCALPVFLSACG